MFRLFIKVEKESKHDKDVGNIGAAGHMTTTFLLIR